MKPVFYILLGILYSTNVKGFLPSYIQPCDFQNGFEKCVTNQIKNSISHFAKGIPESKVPSLDPIYVDDINIRGNSLNLTIIKPSIFGLGESELTKFELDPDVELRFVIVSKNVTLTSQYVIDGKILILPIQGHGDAVITIDNLEIDIGSKIVYITDKKGKHVKLVSPTFKYNMDKAYFQLDNLFNGNKQVGAATLKVLNENWKIVMDDVAPTAVKQTATAVIKAINQFFAGTTADEMMINYKPVYPA